MKFALILYNLIFAILYAPAGVVGYALSKNRKHYVNRLGLCLPKKNLKKSFWFHAASVGEVKSLTNIVQIMRTKFPDISIVVSTMTETGLEIAKSELKPECSFLLPLENFIAIRKAVKRYNTKIFLIAETEIWPNLISAIPKSIPIFAINGRISDKTLETYKRYRKIFRPFLERFSIIFTKSAKDALRFKELSPKSLVIPAGNTKFILNKKPLESDILRYKGKGMVAFAASTHMGEEKFFFDSVKPIQYSFKRIIIAPRHIERVQMVLKLAIDLGFSASLLSQKNYDSKVVIVDKLGVLEQFYQIADRIFIGGSLVDLGGHNIFEALQYEKNIATGLHMENFEDIADLAEKYGMLKYVQTEKQMTEFLENNTCIKKFDIIYDEIKKENEMFNRCFYNAIEKSLAAAKG